MFQRGQATIELTIIAGIIVVIAAFMIGSYLSVKDSTIALAKARAEAISVAGVSGKYVELENVTLEEQGKNAYLEIVFSGGLEDNLTREIELPDSVEGSLAWRVKQSTGYESVEIKAKNQLISVN